MSEPPPDLSMPHAEGGERQAQSALFACLYDELRQIAQRELRRSAGLTLSATTLLHETYLKVQQRAGMAFPDHSRFLAYAARAMRSLVIDYARNRQAQKRGGAFEITSLPTELPELLAREEPAAAIVELDRILGEIGYPHKRVANQLAPMLILKARAELALGRSAAALNTARDARAIAEANAPQPERSATVGAALMVIAEAQRATGDTASARASAERAAAALSGGLGREHSATQAALLFQ